MSVRPMLEAKPWRVFSRVGATVTVSGMVSSRIPRLLAFPVAVALAVALGPAPTRAAQGDCSQPLSNGPTPVSTDCLFILNAAVSLVTCTPACICAPSGELPISATDALVCLQKAVGQAVTLNCPCGSNGSTTVTSSTRLETTTTLFATTTSTTPPLLEEGGEAAVRFGMCEVPR